MFFIFQEMEFSANKKKFNKNTEIQHRNEAISQGIADLKTKVENNPTAKKEMNNINNKIDGKNLPTLEANQEKAYEYARNPIIGPEFKSSFETAAKTIYEKNELSKAGISLQEYTAMLWDPIQTEANERNRLKKATDQFTADKERAAIATARQVMASIPRKVRDEMEEGEDIKEKLKNAPNRSDLT